MSDFFRSQLRASTTEAAEARLRALYGDVDLGGLGGYRESVVGDAAFSLAEVSFDGAFQVQAEVDAITIAYSTPGYAWRVGREEGDLSAAPAVFQPEQPMASRITGDTRVTTLNLAVPALTDLATALYAEPVDVRFAGQHAATPALGRRFVQLVEFMREAVPLEVDLVRATAYHSLAIAALEMFRLEGDRTVRTRTAEAGLQVYRRAGRFIDDHLSLPITLADVARAAGVAEAELHAVFRAHSLAGWDAAERLRQGRLAAAHHDLVAGDPTRGDTVQAIAARWGFAHAGRFAALYRAAYGRSPKHVLDR